MLISPELGIHIESRLKDPLADFQLASRKNSNKTADKKMRFNFAFRNERVVETSTDVSGSSSKPTDERLKLKWLEPQTG